MNTNIRIKYLFRMILAIAFLLCTSTTCMRVPCFKNCTNDTLFIGASLYNNIDSVKYVVWGESPFSDSGPDTLLGNGNFYFGSRDVVYPDSICITPDAGLFSRSDTTYFFLIKWSDAKRYSWDEIREQKLYRRWIVTRDKDGNYDTNIRYSDSDEQE